MILQDLASCMPPVVLLHELLQTKTHGKRRAYEMDGGDEIGTVIDATAAPGNKTTLLSSLMQNKGKVGVIPMLFLLTPPKLLAFEHMPKRFETLEKMVGIAGCQNTQSVLGDFTKCDPVAHGDVTHMWVCCFSIVALTQ